MSDFGQETNDLGVGDFSPRLKAPEELQDQLIAVYDRGVGLPPPCLLARAAAWISWLRGNAWEARASSKAVLRRGNAGEGRFRAAEDCWGLATRVLASERGGVARFAGLSADGSWGDRQSPAAGEGDASSVAGTEG